MRLRDLLAESLLTWWEFFRYRRTVLCMTYGGTMPNGRVRVCENRRGHLDSHHYEFLDMLQGSD